MDLSALTEQDLQSRMDSVLLKLEVLVRELQPLGAKLKEAGHLREEAALLYEEMGKRGIDKSYIPPQERNGGSGQV